MGSERSPSQEEREALVDRIARMLSQSDGEDWDREQESYREEYRINARALVDAGLSFVHLGATPEMIRTGAAAIKAWEEQQPKNTGGPGVRRSEISEAVLRASFVHQRAGEGEPWTPEDREAEAEGNYGEGYAQGIADALSARPSAQRAGEGEGRDEQSLWDEASLAHHNHVTEHGHPRDGHGAWCLGYSKGYEAAQRAGEPPTPERP